MHEPLWLFSRGRSLERHEQLHSPIQNAMNASIFPVTELVIAGFTTIVAMRRAAITSSAYSNISGDGKFNALLQNSLSLDLHRLL
jgi:hypothetical protein